MKTFSSVASMKLATLNASQFVETGGYYTKGGSGAAKYFIKPAQAADGFGDHVLANGNVAVLVVDGAVDVTQFGAKGDGAFTGNAPCIQAALDYSRDVSVPDGIYLTAAAVEIKNDGQHLTGATIMFSEIRGIGSHNVLEFTTTSIIDSAKIEDIHFNASTVTSGHAIYQAVGLAQTEFNRVKLTQKNPAKSCYLKLNGRNYIDNHWSSFDFFHTNSATVPSFSLIDTAGGLANSNSWVKGRATFSGDYVFHIESGAAGTYQYDNVFTEINFEVCSGGGIRALGAYNLSVDNVYLYDTPAGLVKDFIYIGASTNASPLKSRHILLKGVFRRSSTLASGVVDIRLASGEVQGCTIIDGDNATLSGFAVDVGSNHETLIIGSRSWVITNHAYSTTQLIGRQGDAGVVIGGNINYGYHPARAEAAQIVAANGLSTTGRINPQNTAAGIYSGAGDPNSVVAAPNGSIYLRTDGAAGTSLYVKEGGGGGNTGWAGV